MVRYADGTRIKVKGDEYRRIHALISRCTPLAVWEALLANDSLELVRQQLPEEFWSDFDNIVAALLNRLQVILMRAEHTAERTLHLTDKELGLTLHEYSADVRPFLFPHRKHSDVGLLNHPRTREALFRHIRPTGNVLAGYTPSYAMNRVLEDEG